MFQSLDIFEVRRAGKMWMKSAKTLMEALTIMGNAGPGRYVVFSQDPKEMKYYTVDLDDEVSVIEDCISAA